MIVEFLGRTVNLEHLSNHQNIIKFLDEIEPSDHIEVPGGGDNIGKLNRELYSDFDFLTPKENAIISFLVAVRFKRNNLSRKMFPTEGMIMKALSQITGKPYDEAEQQPIDPETWAMYQRADLVATIVDGYFQYGLYARLGFENFYSFDPDGKICAIKNLRNVP